MISDNARAGMQQAPARSLFNALGFTPEEMKKPMVGIVSSFNEIVPGHMNIDKIVEAVKLGVAEAGGVPVVFPAIAVCDGIAMGHVGMKYSLVTRDLIADSTECMAIAHQFDALVMVPNCDKNVPGLLMAAARLNLPTVFVSGGPMLAGHVKGRKRSLSSMFEAVGSYAAGTMTEDDVCEYENKVCPTCGSCSGMYTANSMNCLTEALGMGLRGNGTIPAVYSERIRLAKHAGMAVMDMYNKGIKARDIITKDAIMNALTVDMALGCSTNSMLHLPAIAHEIGFDFDISFANPISERTPNLCHLAPAGPTYMEDLNEAGGVWAVMKELADIGLLNTDCMTVTGKTVGENIKKLSTFINNFGYHIHVHDEVKPKEIQKLLSQVEGTPEEALISRLTLRSMCQAKYTTDNTGHFGLAAKYYTHFTSPIRRYPDLQIHRIIKENLRGRLNENRIEHYDKILPEVAKQCSDRERLAEETEREVVKMKKAEYMRMHIGEEYEGVISGVTKWGIYVELPNTVEGLVHVVDLRDDHYNFIEQTYEMVGEHTGKTYKLGEKVRVRVSDADKLLRTINFELA